MKDIKTCLLAALVVTGFSALLASCDDKLDEVYIHYTLLVVHQLHL